MLTLILVHLVLKSLNFSWPPLIPANLHHMLTSSSSIWSATITQGIWRSEVTNTMEESYRRPVLCTARKYQRMVNGSPMFLSVFFPLMVVYTSHPIPVHLAYRSSNNPQSSICLFFRQRITCYCCQVLRCPYSPEVTLTEDLHGA